MARFELSSLFSDKAVLCRRRELRIFGRAEDNVDVTVTLLDASGSVLGTDTAHARDGRFIAVLPPQEASVHCTLRVSDGLTEALACDIAIGDVYLAGGQSNMELELKDADEGPEAVLRHENLLVRYYNVPKFAMNTPEAEKANAAAHWQEIHPHEGRDMSAVAYFFAMKLQATLSVPVGIIDCYWGGTSITCWMDAETLNTLTEGRRYIEEYRGRYGDKTMAQYQAEEQAFQAYCMSWNAKADRLKREKPGINHTEIERILGQFLWNPPAGPGSPYRPSGLFETMLRRVLPAALTGVLFYQGEEDTGRTDCYEVLLSAFIAQLRRQFRQPRLPFLNVQLPMWIPANGTDTFTWPRLRQAQQTVALQTRDTDLAILIDQGEYDNIHPTNKRVVGERLANCALRTVYDMAADASPVAVAKHTENHCLFVQTDQPLCISGDGPLLLEIADEGGPFRLAEAEISGQTIRLWHPELDHPVRARYAWTDYAAVALFGENGLPLAPFCLE